MGALHGIRIIDMNSAVIGPFAPQNLLASGAARQAAARACHSEETA